MRYKLRNFFARSSYKYFVSFVAVLVVIFAPFLWVKSVNAAQITGRSVTLSDAGGAATGVTYTLTTAALPTGTAVKSVSLTACTQASGSCSTPSGFSVGSSSLASQPTGLGATSSWTVNTATAGSLRITHASNSTAPSGAVSIVWNGVVNPTANNTTFYLRMTTYSDSAWTTSIDSGTIAVSTSQSITVNAQVDENLTFCTGTSGITSSSCAGATGSTVSLNSGNPITSYGTGTSQVGVSTNAVSGYSVTYNGATLTSGANTISAIGATAAAYSAGTEQFGINLKANTSPASFGSDPAGAGSATPTANYNTANSYAFAAGSATSMASKNSADDFRLFTVAYMASVAGTTEAGTYTTTITYVCTAQF